MNWSFSPMCVPCRDQSMRAARTHSNLNCQRTGCRNSPGLHKYWHLSQGSWTDAAAPDRYSPATYSPGPFVEHPHEQEQGVLRGPRSWPTAKRQKEQQQGISFQSLFSKVKEARPPWKQHGQINHFHQPRESRKRGNDPSIPWEYRGIGSRSAPWTLTAGKHSSNPPYGGRRSC
jgi:hypothetical protein